MARHLIIKDRKYFVDVQSAPNKVHKYGSRDLDTGDTFETDENVSQKVLRVTGKEVTEDGTIIVRSESV